ncbi:FAD-dependent oxidoreductase [Novosphingobium pentaromativorans]|uniref:oxidoreductase n=1 Tax=Novosphingobium pentaromativorans TaxID=205844 RepID=UPI00051F8558|nr:FAD-dependent oxidoreductase [Novosphingobium pentaromativorans]AIT80029.1 NADH:flavin oxidoreductase [Novosphingobium pentaromativorans US6-1]
MKKAYTNLFSPIQLGSLKLKNRVVMAPMSTSLGGIDGRVTPDQIAFYQERARGGFGLIVVEFTSVDPDTGRTELHQLSLESDRNLDGHYRLVDALHESGAKAFLQLQHGGRFSPAKFLKDGIVRGPSRVWSRKDPTKLVVEEMDDALVRRLVDAFGAAAGRAARAGYDGIELHGAHGYLLSQFMSPLSNQRDDAWGGDAERRMAFPIAVIKSVREAIGDLPFCYRISADEFVEGGLDIDDTAQICRHLVDAGIDIIHASTGRGPQSFDKVMEPMSAPEGWRLPYARRLREATGVPVIGVGQIRLPETAENAIADGDCDLVALGRPSLTDPYWPAKAQAGTPELIRPCTTCNFCIAAENLHRVTCAENPRTGRELQAPIPADLGIGKKAIVVGAGPGGISTALMLIEAGFETHLYEARETLGGGIIASGAPPGKELLLRYRDYLDRQVTKSGVCTHVGHAVTADEVAALSPDLVVIAAGTRRRSHGIEGEDSAMAVEAYDLLMGDSDVTLGEGDRVVVYGGGETGCEASEFAAARGAMVTLVTRSRADQLARSAEMVYRSNLVDRLMRHDRITVLAGHHLVRIGDRLAVVRNGDGAESELEADYVLLAQGRDRQSEIADDLIARGIPTHIIGDSRQGGRIGDAVHDGYEAMRAIIARYGKIQTALC